MEGQGDFGFDHGSASNSSAVNQKSLFNNLMDTQNIPDCLLAARDRPTSHGIHDIAKVEQPWSSADIIAEDGSSSIEKRELEVSGSVSKENMNTVRNHNCSNSVPVAQSSGQDVLQTGMTSQSCDLRLSSSTHLSSSSGSSDPCGNPSGFASEDGDRSPSASFDGPCVSRKRKNIEGISGQPSTSRSTNGALPTESDSFDPDSTTANAASAISDGPSSSENYGSLNPSEALVSERFRIRFNPSQQLGLPRPDPWAPRIPILRSTYWPHDHLSSRSFPVHRSQEPGSIFPGSSLQNQPPTPLNLHLPQTCSTAISVGSGERMPAPGGETNPISVSMNDLHEMPYLLPSANDRNASQEPTGWGLASGSTNASGNIPPSLVTASSGVLPMSERNWAPNSELAARRLLELARRSSAPPGTLDSGGLVGNPSQSPGHSVVARETGHHPQFGLRTSNQALLRSAFRLDRHMDGLGGPFQMGREGRTRLMAEIWNAFSLMRRAENLRFEGGYFLDPAMFYMGADLQDRHRDMRLDVDNMSYEELLALEERIGNVSTGLDKEAIAKGLKRRHFQMADPEDPSGTEPCSICQEDYVEGQELGALTCSHDFHSSCIKQWLLLKNLCPICKETGLLT